MIKFALTKEQYDTLILALGIATGNTLSKELLKCSQSILDLTRYIMDTKVNERNFNG